MVAVESLTQPQNCNSVGVSNSVAVLVDSGIQRFVSGRTRWRPAFCGWTSAASTAAGRHLIRCRPDPDRTAEPGRLVAAWLRGGGGGNDDLGVGPVPPVRRKVRTVERPAAPVASFPADPSADRGAPRYSRSRSAQLHAFSQRPRAVSHAYRISRLCASAMTSTLRSSPLRVRFPDPTSADTGDHS